MDNKILGGIIIIIFVTVFLVFFSQESEKKELTFSEGIKGINLLWEKNKVNSAYLTSNDSELKFSSSDLDALSDDLIEFQNSLNDLDKTEDVEALKDFTKTNILMVEELQTALQLKNTKDNLEEVTGEDICTYKNELTLMGENTIKLNEKISSVNESINFFNENHSNFIEEANLTFLIVDETEFSKIKLENETTINELKEACP